MYALELPAVVDERQQIHLQLPSYISAKQVRVLIMYEQSLPQINPSQSQSTDFIAALMQMPDVGNDDDFARINPDHQEDQDVFN